MVKDGSLLKVFNLCLEPININSVFDLLRVILFADNYSVILVSNFTVHISLQIGNIITGKGQMSIIRIYSGMWVNKTVQ